ncbi:MAG: TonB-dependent receptor [Prevotella sp.]|nr:TonB-dependent receptor [Prevotella sp.]
MYKPLFLKREMLVFRQFQRKGYSLFACLGREVIISVLSVATLSATKAAGISDEVWRVDSAGHVREVFLSDVGVTGSRAPLATSQAARMVTVLSREDIAQAPVQSVNDLLKYAVGVDVRQRGALGSQTDVSIRGGTQEQITVLLNGVNIGDPQTGHNTLDLPCQLEDIVRIEVLEGPAGRVYGTSSLVGAINIVTTSLPQPLQRRGEVKLEAGSYGYAKAAFTASLPQWREVGGGLSASYSRSDGYSRSRSGNLNTGYSGSKAFYQGAYDTRGLRVNWHLGLSDRGWGSGTFYATPRWQADEQYEHTTKLFADVQADLSAGGDLQSPTFHLQPAIYWQQHRDRYEGYHDRPDLMPYNYNRCDVYGVKVNGYFDSPLGRTAIGAELRNEDLVSGNLGEPLFRTHHINGTDRDYTLGINRTNISAHLEHNVLLRRLTISAGFVAAKSSWSDMNMTLYPGIDLSYRIPFNVQRSRGLANGSREFAIPVTLKLFAGWNTSLRLPTFTEMYYKLQGYAADPHLKPEEMQALEVGAQLATPHVEAKTTLFHHHGRNMIDWVMDTSLGDAAVWQSVNHTRINTTGLEISLTTQFSPLTAHLSYTYLSQDKHLSDGLVSQYALEYLRHKLVATIQAPLWRNLSGRLGLRWQDRKGTYTTFSGDLCPYRPYALMDARLSWTQSRITLYAEASNLLNNRSYVDFGNVPQPGRWLVVGFSWRYVNLP